jgi:hypothetical protein
MSEAVFALIEQSIRKSLRAGLAAARAERDRDIARAAGTCVVHLHQCATALAALDMTGADVDPAEAAAITAARALVEDGIEVAALLLRPSPATAP